MNFLELCQAAARESRTVDSGRPLSVVGQVGREAKFVHWVREAWREIQIERNAWRFMRRYYSAGLLPDTMAYTPASLAITDLNRWIDEKIDRVTIYKTSLGAADESEIRPLDYADFRATYLRGVHDANRPMHWSVSPDNELMIGPKPDAAYTVQGPYQRTAQVLVANADTPICPTDYHMVIVWRALKMMSDHDEALAVGGTADFRARTLMNLMETTQLPQLRMAVGPLA